MSDIDSDLEETTTGAGNLQRIVPPKILSELAHLDLSGRLKSKPKVVGNGAFGDIYTGRCEHPKHGRIKVAIKLLRLFRNEDVKALFEKEIYVWAKLNHRNILPLLGYAFEDQTGYPLLVSDWMKNGSAWTYVFSNHEFNLVHLITGIARGLSYLHEKDIVHSDIKSDNVLVTDTGDAVICDFGCTRMIEPTRTMANLRTGILGTAQYTAFEIFARPDEYKKNSKATDVWAFGMTTYELLLQKRPYAGLIPSQIQLRISSGILPMIPISLDNHSPQVTKLLSQICSRCWELDPAHRVDIATLLQELEDHALLMKSSPQSLKSTSEGYSKQSESKRFRLGKSGQSSEDIRGVDAFVLSSDLDYALGPTEHPCTTVEMLFDGCDDRSLYTESSDDCVVSFNSKVERRVGITPIRTLNHESTVCCVRFSPNGKHLATGCNRAARVYNTKTGHIRCILIHGTNATQDLHVRTLCFSPNGKLLATGSEDKLIRVWDLAIEKVKYTLEGHEKDVYSLEFTNDAKNVVSGSLDGSIRIWNMRTLSHRILKMNDSISDTVGVTSISISPDGLQIAAAYLDATVRVWNFNTGELTKRLLGHVGSINSVLFTPSGECIVSGGSDKTLRSWGIRAPSIGPEQDKPLLCFIGHKDAVSSIAATSDGQWVVSGSRDHSIQFWETKTARAHLHVQSHKSAVTSIDISSRNGDGMLASGSGDMQVRLWSYNSATSSLSTPLFKDVILSDNLKKDGPSWSAIFNPNVKRVLDINLSHNLVHESMVCCVRFSMDGKFLATGCNRTAQIYDTQSGQKLCVLNDEAVSPMDDLYIRSICFSPDGKFLATGAEDKTIRIWDISKKRVKRVFEGHQQEIYSLTFSRNGRLIISGSGDRTVRIWDMETGMQKILEINEPDTDPGVTDVAISPNSRFVAAGSLDTVVRVWEVRTGNLVERLKGHRDSVYSVVFTPDGNGIISGSLDKTLKHWDISRLTTTPEGMEPLPPSVEVITSYSVAGPMTRSSTSSMGGERGSTNAFNFICHKDYVLSVAVSHDGQWVVSGSKDRGVQFWDLKTAQMHALLQGHKNSVISVDLSPIGGMLATGSGDMTARLWTYSAI